MPAALLSTVPTNGAARSGQGGGPAEGADATIPIANAAAKFGHVADLDVREDGARYRPRIVAFVVGWTRHAAGRRGPSRSPSEVFPCKNDGVPVP